MLLTRPGLGPVSNLDRDWSVLLTASAAGYRVPMEPIFRANDELLVEVTPKLKLTD